MAGEPVSPEPHPAALLPLGSKATYLLLSPKSLASPLEWWLCPARNDNSSRDSYPRLRFHRERGRVEPLELLGVVARSKMGFWIFKPGLVWVRIWWKEKILFM